MKNSPEETQPPDPDLVPTMHQLDRAAREERDVLREARAQADPEDLRFVEAALERAAGAPRGRRGPTLVWWLTSAAAAAILVALSIDWGADANSKFGSDPGPSGLHLGEGDLQILAPAGEGAAFGSIRWNYPQTLGTSFELRVYSADDATSLLYEQVVVERTTFDVPFSQALKWPDRIRVELRAFDSAGELVATASSSASR